MEFSRTGSKNIYDESHLKKTCSTESQTSNYTKQKNGFVKHAMITGVALTFNLCVNSQPQDSFLAEYDTEIYCQSYFSDVEYITNFKTKAFTLKNKIRSYTQLENNWDGYGAIPLEIRTFENALSIIELIDARFWDAIESISPNPHGTLNIRWTNRNKEKVSVEVGNKTFSYFVKFNGKDPEFFDDIVINSVETKKLSDFVSKL